MKKEVLKRSLIILAVLFLSVNINISAIGNQPNQNSQDRDLPSFTEINLAISANIYLKQSDKQSFKIEASDEMLELIETKVSNGELTIKWKKNNVSHSEKIKIYISMKDINALKISGSGDIIADGKIETQNLELKISGSGDISLNELNAKNISAKISGSADIVINGGNDAEKLDISISGSGDVKTSGLKVKEVEVTVSGSGDCYVYASEKLTARVAGSGDIYYSGNAFIDAKVAGSGSIKHR
ncbi:MAG: DUF2807 domain-containing protein [Bacteroidales bacterium]|nr:DUF2807 domain-containing protein [Bacteroidales bacterium]